MEKLLRQEIKQITKENIVIFGDIQDHEKNKIGKHGVIDIPISLMEKLGIYEDWKNTNIFGPTPHIMFSLLNGDNKKLEIKFAVADYTTAPIEDYIEKDVANFLYSRIYKLLKD